MTGLRTNIKALTRLQRGTFIVSLGLLLLSFFFPAFYIDRTDYDAWADGKYLFFLGWMSFLGGNLVASLIWSANAFYIVSILLTIKGRIAGLFFGLLAPIVALGFSRLDTIMTDEAGHFSKITALKAGYNLWVASFAVLAIGTAMNAIRSRLHSTDKHEPSGELRGDSLKK